MAREATGRVLMGLDAAVGVLVPRPWRHRSAAAAKVSTTLMENTRPTNSFRNAVWHPDLVPISNTQSSRLRSRISIIRAIM
jgi:hypothetical protein